MRGRQGLTCHQVGSAFKSLGFRSLSRSEVGEGGERVDEMSGENWGHHDWVAVKEFHLSYYNEETLFFIIDPYTGNLNACRFWTHQEFCSRASLELEAFER